MKTQIMNLMATQELILRFYREPHLFKDLKNPGTPLPRGMGEVLLALHKFADKNDLDYLELREAMITFACSVFFLPRASAYRVLGLNNNAPPAQIDEHYLLLHDLFSVNNNDPEYKKIFHRLDEAYAKLSPGREPPSLEEIVTAKHHETFDESASQDESVTMDSLEQPQEEPIEAKPPRQTYSEDTFIGKVFAFFHGEGKPLEYAYLNSPLPTEFTELLVRAADAVAVASGQRDDEVEHEIELRDAVAYYIKKALFVSGANHYRILGLESNASAELIQTHYRLLRRLFSPDEEDIAVRNMVARISEAYVILRDPIKRRNYDASQGRITENVFMEKEPSSKVSANTRVTPSDKSNKKVSRRSTPSSKKSNVVEPGASANYSQATNFSGVSTTDTEFLTDTINHPEPDVRRKLEPSLGLHNKDARIFPEIHAQAVGRPPNSFTPDRNSNAAGLKVVIGVVGIVIGIVAYFAGSREPTDVVATTPLTDMPASSAPIAQSPPVEDNFETAPNSELSPSVKEEMPSEPAEMQVVPSTPLPSEETIPSESSPITNVEEPPTVPSEETVQLAPTPETSIPAPDPAVLQRDNNVKQLLAKAETEYRLKQLTQPPGRNAAESYQDVLKIDSSNQQAKEGLMRIADRYLRMARQRRAEGNEIEGIEMISKGLTVVPEHEGLLALMDSLGDDLAKRDAREAARLANEENKRLEREIQAKRDREQELREKLARDATQIPSRGSSNNSIESASPPADEPQLNSPDSAPKADSSVEEGVSLSDAELNSLITRFVELYEAGDLNTFMGLFASNARANNRDSRDTIRQDYATLFEQTDTRLMMIKDLKWDKGNRRAIGEAQFELTIKRKGSDDSNVYSGNITFQVERTGTTPLITGVYHSQRKLNQ